MSHDASTDRQPTAAAAPFAAACPAEPLRTAIDAVAVLVDECVVRVDSGGLSVDAIDPATVGMVSLSLGTDAFDAYDATETRLGVDLERLSDVVGMAGRDERVHLALDPETRKLHVDVEGLSYTLALVDPDAIRSPPDGADFSEQFVASATVEGAEFSRAVEAASMVSSHVALGVDQEDPRLYARADGDTDSAAFELAAADCAEFDPGPAHSLFSLQYLEAVDRAVPSDRPVRLRMGEEAPVEIAFDIADGDGAVEYLVSPRLTRN